MINLRVKFLNQKDIRLQKIFNIFLLASVLTSSTLMVGCKPRGESKSLQQIVSDASDVYHKAYDGQPFQGSVSAVLPALSKDLNKLVQPVSKDEQQKLASSVVEYLKTLVFSAGYTSRPALGELINQFGQVAAGEVVNKDSVMLLVSKTFFLLASELKGVRFGLGDRELRK